jgi:hypothetical protein
MIVQISNIFVCFAVSSGKLFIVVMSLSPGILLRLPDPYDEDNGIIRTPLNIYYVYN